MKILFTILLFTVFVSAQTVEVPQPLLDSANRAFLEVQALREENRALKTEIAEKDGLISALSGENDALKILVNEKNKEIEVKNRLIVQLEDRDVVRLKEIEALRALKCNKNVYLFGVIKTIRCR